MDTSEKVKQLNSFDELTKEIIRDMNTNDMLAQRYAIRFIMLNNFNVFKELAKFMVNIGVAILDLENLINESEDDTWITKDILIDAIKECKSSTFITPFSEIVRFYSDEDFRGFLNEIMLLEDIYNPNKRIYIPLIGLQNRFIDFLNHFARIKESAPIWRFDSETQSVKVYFTKYKDFALPNESTHCLLRSLREWLMFWKRQAPQDRIVCTSLPLASKYKYSKADNIFTFTSIANAYEFMTQFLELHFPFEYEEEDQLFWELLLNKLDKNTLSIFSFETFVLNSINKVKLDALDLISVWTNATTTEYDRWLLKNYALYTCFTDSYPYLTLCIKSVISLADGCELMNLIVTRILYNDISTYMRPVYATERRTIIVASHYLFDLMISKQDRHWFYDRVREISQMQNGIDFAIELCTGVFDFEKKMLMAWSVYYPNNNKLLEAINNYYPEYAAYLKSSRPSHLKVENNWILDYINAYKRAKIEDKYLDEISSFIKTKNNTEANFYQWYFDFDETHSVLAEMNSNSQYKPDLIFWVDGLGIEFLSYILYLIDHENTNIKVVHSQITRSLLPTSTHHNRFEGDIVKKINSLDELGHDSHGYKHFDTLIAELRIIKNIVQEIFSISKKQKCIVAIVSDHGLSCLSRMVPSKKYDGKFEHEGRYIKTTYDTITDSDYLAHYNKEDSQKYKIALTHSSLSKVPTHQVHGGCTPEEVLVPFILLSNKNLTNGTRYNIICNEDEIMLSDPIVHITIIPQPNSVILTCAGNTYNMDRVGMQWTSILHDITEGTYTIGIEPYGAESTELTIKIIGIVSNTDINDMFDL